MPTVPLQERGEEWNLSQNHGEWHSVQRHISRDCRYSFVACPPNYGYGKHYPDDVREKGVRTRVKTSLRKAADLFRIIGNVIISHVKPSGNMYHHHSQE